MDENTLNPTTPPATPEPTTPVAEPAPVAPVVPQVAAPIVPEANEAPVQTPTVEPAAVETVVDSTPVATPEINEAPVSAPTVEPAVAETPTPNPLASAALDTMATPDPTAAPDFAITSGQSVIVPDGQANKKPVNKKLLIVILIGVMLAAAIVLVVLYLSTQNSSTANTDQVVAEEVDEEEEEIEDEDEEEEDDDDEETALVAEAEYDSTRCVNIEGIESDFDCASRTYDTTLSGVQTGSGITTHVTTDGVVTARIDDDSKRVVTLEINWDAAKGVYWTEEEAPADKSGATKEPITFSKDVSDVFIGGVGQGYSGGVLFFIMSDGTLQYMRLVDALRNSSYVSQGEISGANNVVSMGCTGASEYVDGNWVGSYVTTVAVRVDGSFYNLEQVSGLF